MPRRPSIHNDQIGDIELAYIGFTRRQLDSLVPMVRRDSWYLPPWLKSITLKRHRHIGKTLADVETQIDAQFAKIRIDDEWFDPRYTPLVRRVNLIHEFTHIHTMTATCYAASLISNPDQRRMLEHLEEQSTCGLTHAIIGLLARRHVIDGEPPA